MPSDWLVDETTIMLGLFPAPVTGAIEPARLQTQEADYLRETKKDLKVKVQA